MTSPLDTLTSNNVKQLLYDKYILILGDSVVRGLYKDLIKFSGSDDLLTEEELRVKGENRFYGDRLINGGVQKGLTNGIEYEEVREYTAGGRLRIRFYFLTRCYSPYLKCVVFNDIQNQAIKPDIIIMNSCVWDISRYGIYAMKSYQNNIDCIMGSFRQMLPDALFLWLSALPVSNSSKGGVIVSKAEYIRPILPGLIRDGNYHCSQLCNTHDVLYVDFHSTFSNMLHLRRPDGIHWCAIGNRIMNEIILNHIKAYNHGVKDFKCPLLRAELETKINRFKQRMKNYHQNHSKINYLEKDMVDHDDDEIQILPKEKDDYKKSYEDSSTSKRKRNNDDDEKENYRKQSKVITKSITTIKNEERTVIVKNSSDLLETKQEKIIDNQMYKFNHEYCDIMYDNEFEGLHLLHFSAYENESLEEKEDIQVSNEIQIKREQTESKMPKIDGKISESIISSVLLPISNNDKEGKLHEIDCIVLSSDDEDEPTPSISLSPASSTTTILPIYLLNRQ